MDEQIIRITDTLVSGDCPRLCGALLVGDVPVPAELDFCISDREIPGVPVCIFGRVVEFIPEAPTPEAPARRYRALIIGDFSPADESETAWFDALSRAELSVMLSPMADGQMAETWHDRAGYHLFEAWNDGDILTGRRGDARFGFDSALRAAHPAFMIASGENVRLRLDAAPTRESVLQGLRRGAFTITAGVELLSVTADETNIRIRTTPCRHIRLVSLDCRGRGARDPARKGLICEAELPIPERAKFVRVECEGENGAFAFSQPFFVHWPYEPKLTETFYSAIPARERNFLFAAADIATAGRPYRHDHAPLSHGNFYKGNLHIHSTRSDGEYTVDELIERYKAEGYSFLALTDHVVYTRSDPYQRPDFITLSGVEADACSGTYDYNTTPETRRYNYHLNAIRTDYSEDVREVEDGFMTDTLTTKGERQASSVRQRVQQIIDYYTVRGCSVFLNHPRWSCNYEQDIYGFRNVAGMEIFNHGAFFAGDDLGEDYWRYCNENGMHMYCTATDDIHHDTELFGGWIVVSAPELTRAAIGEAIRKGRFYASTGAEILDWRAEDSGRVSLRCAPAEEIRIGVIGRDGMTLRGESLTEATFDAKPGDIVYARVRAKNGLAWTNPMEI
ncbi:MAG: hypothetical protein IJC53_01430 [Clostridia bacterium]|nr:hypothetical protein [Clostridia bacterium]